MFFFSLSLCSAFVMLELAYRHHNVLSLLAISLLTWSFDLTLIICFLNLYNIKRTCCGRAYHILPMCRMPIHIAAAAGCWTFFGLSFLCPCTAYGRSHTPLHILIGDAGLRVCVWKFWQFSVSSLIYVDECAERRSTRKSFLLTWASYLPNTHKRVSWTTQKRDIIFI